MMGDGFIPIEGRSSILRPQTPHYTGVLEILWGGLSSELIPQPVPYQPTKTAIA